MKVFKYTVLDFEISTKRKVLESELNLMGSLGWELVSFVLMGSNGCEYRYVFKMEVNN